MNQSQMERSGLPTRDVERIEKRWNEEEANSEAKTCAYNTSLGLTNLFTSSIEEKTHCSAFEKSKCSSVSYSCYYCIVDKIITTCIERLH